jgi:hypothetical protein
VMNRARFENSRSHNRKTLGVIAEVKSTGVKTLAEISKCLNMRGHKTIRGGMWYPKTVRDVLMASHVVA